MDQRKLEILKSMKKKLIEFEKKKQERIKRIEKQIEQKERKITALEINKNILLEELEKAIKDTTRAAGKANIKKQNLIENQMTENVVKYQIKLEEINDQLSTLINLRNELIEQRDKIFNHYDTKILRLNMQIEDDKDALEKLKKTKIFSHTLKLQTGKFTPKLKTIREDAGDRRRNSVKKSRRKSAKKSRRKSVKKSRRKSVKKSRRKSVKKSRRKSVKK
jgi:hypothetical protein